MSAQVGDGRAAEGEGNITRPEDCQHDEAGAAACDEVRLRLRELIHERIWKLLRTAGAWAGASLISTPLCVCLVAASQKADESSCIAAACTPSPAAQAGGLSGGTEQHYQFGISHPVEVSHDKDPNCVGAGNPHGNAAGLGADKGGVKGAGESMELSEA